MFSNKVFLEKRPILTTARILRRIAGNLVLTTGLKT